MTHHLAALLALCLVVVGEPTASQANPFSKLLKSVKIQKSSPAAGSAAAPAQGATPPQAAPPPQPMAPPVAHPGEVPDQPGGHPRCKPAVFGTDSLTPADNAAVQRITTTASSIAKVDLNGDGKPDFVLVDSDYCGTAGCQTHVYVSRGGVHEQVFSTEYMADIDDIGPGTTNGMCDLVSDGFRYAWNGKTYVSQGPATSAKRPAEIKAAKASQPLVSYGGKKAFSEIVLAEPALEKEFQKLMGDSYGDFINHFTISENAVVENGYLVGDGCQVHNCDSEFAVGAVRIKDHALYGAILSLTIGPKFEVFASRKGELPKPMKARMEFILKKHELEPTPHK